MTKLSNHGFTFKRFFVVHDKSPMKVTTDSCLLGAWSPINQQTQTVLDIGCGCGVITLMLAQRLTDNQGFIDGVDIDTNAVLQCQQNIDLSPFHNITAQCVDINQYKLEVEHYYDLIVSNPPYFTPAVDCRDEQRQQARYTENLDHIQLIKVTKRLLKQRGYFCVVLPYHLSEKFKQLCVQQDLYLAKQLDVKYSEMKDASLILLCFTPQIVECSENKTLVMRNSDTRYTDDFRDLLQDFYLFRNQIKSN